MSYEQPRTLVISFPRSGLNWLRHCTEYFGGLRTPGRTQLIGEGDALFDRTHDVMRPNKRSDFAALRNPDGSEPYGAVALLLRNPCDCFASHYLGRKAFSFRQALPAFETFATNIVEFDRLRRARKAVFYFEDFINQEKGTFEFLRFMGIDPTVKPYSLAALTVSSRAWYRDQHGVINEQQRSKLTAKRRAAIWKMLELRLSEKFDIYLGRYRSLAERSD